MLTNRCLDVAPEKFWACSQVESEMLGLMHVDVFAHAYSSAKVHLESLHRLLPEGIMTSAGQLVRAFFEYLYPGRGYTYKDSPRIKKVAPRDHTPSNGRHKISGGLPRLKRGMLSMPFGKYVQSMVLAGVDEMHGCHTH